jgi:uncharacterized protein
VRPTTRASAPPAAIECLGVERGGETLTLRADRSVLIESRSVLLVADVHLGKAASFRRLGIPVPEASTGDTLDRLSTAVARTGACRLVVLGDLLHGPGCLTPPVDEAWRRFAADHPALDVMLVRGNHDHRAGDPPAHWRVSVVAPGAVLGGLLLCHEPPIGVGANRSWLAGHVHPAMVLRGRVGDRVRLPCFHLRPDGLVLPAFGAFTGSHCVESRPGDRLIAVTPDGLWEPVRPSAAGPAALRTLR